MSGSPRRTPNGASAGTRRETLGGCFVSGACLPGVGLPRHYYCGGCEDGKLPYDDAVETIFPYSISIGQLIEVFQGPGLLGSVDVDTMGSWLPPTRVLGAVLFVGEEGVENCFLFCGWVEGGYHIEGFVRWGGELSFLIRGRGLMGLHKTREVPGMCQ